MTEIFSVGHLIGKGALVKLIRGAFGVDLIGVLVCPFPWLERMKLRTKKVKVAWS